MMEFTIHTESGRFEDRHADLREEIRLMALATEEGADLEAPHPAATAPRQSLLRRLFTRPAVRLAA